MFCEKTAFRTCFFVDFCAQSRFPRFLHDFSSIFLKKSMKNQWKKQCVFSNRRLFFSAWRPSRNTAFYNTKATFSFSVLSYFFLNNIEKNAPKLKPRFSIQKSLKSRPREPFWVPNRFQIHVGEVKKPKNNTKISFLDRAVFQTFFELQKALIRDRLEDPEPGWKGPDPENR